MSFISVFGFVSGAWLTVGVRSALLLASLLRYIYVYVCVFFILFFANPQEDGPALLGRLLLLFGTVLLTGSLGLPIFCFSFACLCTGLLSCLFAGLLCFFFIVLVCWLACLFS